MAGDGADRVNSHVNPREWQPRMQWRQRYVASNLIARRHVAACAKLADCHKPRRTCDYEFQFDTCAVCPEVAQGDRAPPWEAHRYREIWLLVFLDFTVIVLPLYTGLGALYNYKEGLGGVNVLRIQPGWRHFAPT